MKFKHKTGAAELALLAVTLIWGSGFVVVKNATDTISPGYIVAIRFWMAAILMALVFCTRLKKLDRGCLKAGALNGLFLFLAYYLQTLGVKYTTAGNNAFLTTIYVVLVPFLFWAVKHRRPDKFNVSAAILCMVGIGFISLRPGAGVGLGDLLTLLCGAAFAAHIVSTAILTQKHDPILLTIVQFFFTAIFATLTAVPSEPFPAYISGSAFAALLYIGVVATFFALMMQSICQKYIPPSKAALIMSLESVFGCLFGALLLSESITPQSAVGFFLVFAAVVLSETKLSFLRRRPSKAPKAGPE